jgi:TM2 domain-containing membrane protein YozV
MKNKITAGILALVVGGFGVHQYYLGRIGRGVLYSLFFWTSIPFIIAFIEGIILLTMDDEEFNFRYNPHLSRRARHDVNINVHIPTSPDDYRRAERRPDMQQQYPASNRTKTPVTEGNPHRDEGTKLYKEYDFRGAIQEYLKSLQIRPNDSQINFNLACLYSLEEDAAAAFLHLQRAVEQGYNHLDKIQTHDHLAFLRTQPQFETFVRSGYKLQASLAAKNTQSMELTDDVIAKLERLAMLKERGVLTEAEFQAQKIKLING